MESIGFVDDFIDFVGVDGRAELFKHLLEGVFEFGCFYGGLSVAIDRIEGVNGNRLMLRLLSNIFFHFITKDSDNKPT